MGRATPGGEPCAPSAWREQYDLARRLHPEGVVWPYPLSPGLFRRGRPDAWFSGGDNQDWVLHEAGKVSGSLSIRRGAVPEGMRCVLLVDPPSDADGVSVLLASAILHGLSSSRSYWLDYPVGEAVELLGRMGF